MDKEISLGLMALNLKVILLMIKKLERNLFLRDGKIYTGYWNGNNACGTGIYHVPNLGKESIIID